MLPPWVICVTSQSSEELAERGFRQSGYRVYLPRYRKVLLPHGSDRRTAASMRPLFSRALFIQDWRGWPDRAVAGTVGLMMQRPTVPALMNDDDVALILERERAGEFDEIPHARGSSPVRGDIKPGEEILIDAFGSQVLGILERLTTDGKALVSAMLFGGMVPVSIDADALRRPAKR